MTNLLRNWRAFSSHKQWYLCCAALRTRLVDIESIVNSTKTNILSSQELNQECYVRLIQQRLPSLLPSNRIRNAKCPWNSASFSSFFVPNSRLLPACQTTQSTEQSLLPNILRSDLHFRKFLHAIVIGLFLPHLKRRKVFIEKTVIAWNDSLPYLPYHLSPSPTSKCRKNPPTSFDRSSLIRFVPHPEFPTRLWRPAVLLPTLLNQPSILSYFFFCFLQSTNSTKKKNSEWFRDLKRI